MEIRHLRLVWRVCNQACYRQEPERVEKIAMKQPSPYADSGSTRIFMTARRESPEFSTEFSTIVENPLGAPSPLMAGTGRSMGSGGRYHTD